MSYPVGWDLVNITGTYIGRDGNPCVGSVTLSSPQLVLRSGTIVPAADIVFDLVNGTFSGQIPATDDPNASPVGWTYTVTENVPGGRQGYQIVAPHTSPGIDLSTVVPVTMPQPPTYGFPYVTLSQLAGTAVGDGAYLIGFQQNWSGTAARTVQARLSDTVYLTDFAGADPTGASDSTAAINACITHCQTYGKRMYVPAGTYLTDTISYGHPAGSLSDITITGDGSNCTTFVKKSSDSTPLFSAGSTAGFTGNGRIEGITFKGISGNTTACLNLIACDHWTFYDCQFMDALIGVNELGGVSNRYIACEWEYNITNVYLDKAPSPSTSVSANNITFFGCIFGNASDVGVHAETAAQISIMDCDLEANGVVGSAGSSAVYTGASIGSIGINIKNCWIENNGTTAAVYLSSGNNTIEDTLFIANASATYDLYVIGGTYTLKNVIFATSKTNNVYEASGVSSGNSWRDCVVPGYTIDATKTSIQTGTSLAMRSYEVPVVQGTTSPLIQSGQATCNVSGVATVTFPKAFGAAPVINATVIGSNASAVPGLQISGITTSGFTIQTNYWNGTSIGTSAMSVDWIAIGQG